jgi:hypothetical protein
MGTWGWGSQWCNRLRWIIVILSGRFLFWERERVGKGGELRGDRRSRFRSGRGTGAAEEEQMTFSFGMHPGLRIEVYSREDGKEKSLGVEETRHYCRTVPYCWGPLGYGVGGDNHHKPRQCPIGYTPPDGHDWLLG